jgi:hypothetical protein
MGVEGECLPLDRLPQFISPVGGLTLSVGHSSPLWVQPLARRRQPVWKTTTSCTSATGADHSALS